MSNVYRFEKVFSEDELNSFKIEPKDVIALEIRMLKNEIKEKSPNAVITDVCHKITDDFGIHGRHQLITITVEE